MPRSNAGIHWSTTGERTAINSLDTVGRKAEATSAKMSSLRSVGAGTMAGFDRIGVGFGKTVSFATNLVGKLTTVLSLVTKISLVVGGLTVGFAGLGGYIGTQLFSQLQATNDQFRKIDVTMLGVFKDVEQVNKTVAWGMDYAARKPAMFGDVMGMIRGLGMMPAVKPMLKDDRQLERIADMVQGLAALNPVQGVQGAVLSLREALTGQMRSLRQRFDVSPKTIAEVAGTTVQEMSSDPKKMIDALVKFTDEMVGADTLERAAKTWDVQIGNIKDQVQMFTRAIGQRGEMGMTPDETFGTKEGGIYGVAVTSIERLNEKLRGFLQGDEGRAWAVKISDTLSDAWTAGEALVGRLTTGMSPGMGILENLGVLKTNVVEELKAGWELAKPYAEDFWEGVKKYAVKAFVWIQSKAISLFEYIGGKIDEWGGKKDTFSPMVKTMVTGLETAKTVIKQIKDLLEDPKTGTLISKLGTGYVAALKVQAEATVKMLEFLSDHPTLAKGLGFAKGAADVGLGDVASGAMMLGGGILGTKMMLGMGKGALGLGAKMFGATTASAATAGAVGAPTAAAAATTGAFATKVAAATAAVGSLATGLAALGLVIAGLAAGGATVAAGVGAVRERRKRIEAEDLATQGEKKLAKKVQETLPLKYQQQMRTELNDLADKERKLRGIGNDYNSPYPTHTGGTIGLEGETRGREKGRMLTSAEQERFDKERREILQRYTKMMHDFRQYEKPIGPKKFLTQEDWEQRERLKETAAGIVGAGVSKAGRVVAPMGEVRILNAEEMAMQIAKAMLETQQPVSNHGTINVRAETVDEAMKQVAKKSGGGKRPDWMYNS